MNLWDNIKMDIVSFLGNYELMLVPVCSWMLAQILKTFIHGMVNKTFHAERLIGGGGMPSAHSATVCSLATICAIRYGTNSFEFAMTLIFAIVTMYDAMNVRWETGKQGRVLNDLLEAFNEMAKQQVGPDKALKELIGHSPLQVLVGGLLGMAMAFGIHFGILVG